MKNWKMWNNLKFGVRMVISFSILIVLLLAGSVMSYLNLDTTTKNMKSMYVDRVVCLGQFNDMLQVLNAINTDLQILGLDLGQNSGTLQDIQAQIDKFNKNLTDYKATYLLDSEIAGLTILESAWTSYQNNLMINLGYIKSNRLGDFKINVGSFSPAAVASGIDTLAQVNVTEAGRLNNLASKTASSNMLFTIILAVISIGMALGIGIILTVGMTHPVKRLIKGMQKVALGDISEKIVFSTNDEIGQMGVAYREMQAYLVSISNTAEKISTGDLSVHIAAKSEQDTLGNSFVKMLSNLRQLIKKVNDNAVSMASASAQLASASEQSGSATDQIASVSQQVAKGAEEQTRGIGDVNDAITELAKAIESVNAGSQQQAKAVEQVTSIVQQVSEAAESTASSAQEAANKASQAADVARQGSSTVEKTIEGIHKINVSMQDVAKRVSELGKHSEEIGGMIAVIDDIAAQTNLLALNAAIEAARAGEQGRGFAVVADEVKKLAERTAKETKEISSLVGSVQKGVAESIKASMDGAKQAEEGSNLANEAGTALGQILDSINGMTSQIEQISAAAEEMSASAGEMVKVVDSVAKLADQNLNATKMMAGNRTKVSDSTNTVAATIEQNSAATQQMSASAQEMSAQVQQVVASSKSLSSMADELKKAISTFKVDADAGKSGKLATNPMPA